MIIIKDLKINKTKIITGYFPYIHQYQSIYQFLTITFAYLQRFLRLFYMVYIFSLYPRVSLCVISMWIRLRFLRYDPGEYFKPHFDGVYMRDNGERSCVTIQLYLNEVT